MPPNTPRITIISTCYNYGRYFDEWYAGLKSQIVKPDLVVIVDDASTDGSGDLIVSKLFANNSDSHVDMTVNDPAVTDIIRCTKDGLNFVIIQMSQNGGPSKARNTAIKASLDETDIYAVYDMDDIYYPNKISRSLEAFKKFPHVGVVYSDYDTKDTRTGHKEREIKEPFDYIRLCQECIVSNNSLIAAGMLKRAGIYDETMRVAEDYDLWLRLAEVGMLYHIPEPLYEYRVTGNGASFSVDKKVWQECWQKVQQKRIDRRQK